MKNTLFSALLIGGTTLMGTSSAFAATFERANVNNGNGVYVPAIVARDRTKIRIILIGQNGLTKTIYYNDALLKAFLSSIPGNALFVQPDATKTAPIVEQQPDLVVEPPLVTDTSEPNDPKTLEPEQVVDPLPEPIIEPEDPDLVIDPLPTPIIEPKDPELVIDPLPEPIIEPEEPELIIDPLPEPIIVPLDPEDPNANGPQVCPDPPVLEMPLPDAS